MSKLPAPVLAAILGIKLGESTMDAVLDRLVQIARDAMEGIDEVSITLVRGDEPFTAAHSGPLALAADELQYERGYGPCIEAGLSGTLLLVQDMRVETRWPDYAQVVVPEGVLGSLSIPLPLQTELVGALNCYSRTPDAITDETVDVGTELAAHIAVALGNVLTHSQTARYADDMKAAMASRAVIEQAKGVIMAQNRCDPETAFEILRRASMGRNVKLRDVANDLVSKVSGSGS